MALEVVPSIFTAQPQYPAPLDRSQPLTQYIEQAYFPAGWGLRDLGGNSRNLANTGASISTCLLGPSFKTAGNSSSYFAAPSAAITRFTLEAYYVPNAATNQYICGTTEAPNSTTHDRELWIDNLGKFTFYIYDGAVKTAVSTSTAVVNTPVHLIGVSDGTNIYLYVNGILEAITAAGTAYTGYTSPEFLIGNGFNADTPANVQIPGSGWLNYAIRYNKALSASEVSYRYNGKFSLLQAPDEEIWIASGGAVPLASNSTPTATGSGTLSVAIPITGASASGVTGQGTLSIALPLAGAGNAAVVGSATLSIAQALLASGLAGATGQGTLGLAIPLNSAALATALGAGTLNGSVALGGNAAAGVTGSGNLTLSIALSSAAIANALGSGNLAVSGSLGGASAASVTGSGSLSQAIPIQSASLAATNASGNLTQLVPITASSSVLASGQGALHITVNLSAAALAQAIGVGNLTLRLALSGASIANAIATGALSGIVRPINPKYSITGYARIRSITAAPRVRSVVGM